MTHDELQAIKARAEAATLGPWTAETVGPCSCGQCPAHVNVFAGPHQWPKINPPDAEFIAHARTDVPALVAEVERLRWLCDGVAQKLLGTEFDTLVRQGHEFLPEAVGSLRANRDSLVRRMRMT